MVNNIVKKKKFPIPNAYLSVYCKLLLVLEKVFYKVKIKSKIAIFFFYVALWPVYVPKCFFSTMSPHKLQPILRVSTFCKCHLLGLIHGLPSHFSPGLGARQPSVKALTCSTGSFDFVPEGWFAHLKCAYVRV